MQKEEIEIEDKITYSLENMSFSQPLKIINHSNQTYAFKVSLLLFRLKPTKKQSFRCRILTSS